MADRQRTSGKRIEPDRKTSSRRGAVDKQPPRRNDVIRCENCGEDYSITYKRCPFCDERPGHGRRAVGGGLVHPVQVISLVVSLILIIAALFIVFKYVGPLLFTDRSGGSDSSVSQSGLPGSASGAPDLSGSASSGDSQPEAQIDSITLSQTDLTLQTNAATQIVVTVSPADTGAEVVWSSSQPDVLTVDQHGVVRNINTGSDQVKVTVTATCGGKSAECTVYCKGGSSGAAASTGVVINVGSDGLNIRSGPGSSYDVVASAENGALVNILEDTGTGWYKIDYGSGKIGYVSSDYVSTQN